MVRPRASLDVCTTDWQRRSQTAQLQGRTLNFRRDKDRHERDFVVATDPNAPTSIEAKWSVGAFDPKNLKAFRASYPMGRTCSLLQTCSVRAANA
jgi:hypothetical protein